MTASTAELSDFGPIHALLAGDPAALANPSPVYRAIRENAGALALDDVVVLARYDDVRNALRDNTVLSSRGLVDGSWIETARSRLDGDDLAAFNEVISFQSHFASRTDGADHRRIRSVASKLFTARNIAVLDGAARRYSAELVAELIATENPDGMVLAARLPLLMMGDLLGVESVDLDSIQKWSTALGAAIGRSDGPTMVAAREAQRNFIAYLDRMLERYESEPHPTELVKVLMAARAQGQLEGSELAAMFVQLLFAGHETTMTLIGAGLLELLRYPAQWQLLVDDPTRIPNAVEELLRLITPSQFAARVTLADTTVADIGCPHGRTVLAAMAGANRDPDVFVDPDRLDVLRESAREHLSFGAGPHFCLGAALARLEAIALFEQLIEQAPGLELTDAVPAWTGGPQLRKLISLPLKIRPQGT